MNLDIYRDENGNVVVNDFAWWGMMVQNPQWLLTDVYVDGELVECGDLPLGGFGYITSVHCNYALLRTMGVTMGKLDDFLAKHKVKLVFYDRNEDKEFSILWSGSQWILKKEV